MTDLPELSAAATQGEWNIRNKVGVLFGPDVQIAKFGDFFDKGLAHLNGERWNADAQLCAALVNAYRTGQLVERAGVVEAIAAIKAFLPKINLANEAWADGTIVPLDVTLGELRGLRAALNALGGDDAN